MSFWETVAAGTISAVLGGLTVPFIQYLTRRSLWPNTQNQSSRSPRTLPTNGQTISASDNATINVKQQAHNHSQTINVTQVIQHNLNQTQQNVNARGRSQDSDTATGIVIAVVFLVATAVFVQTYVYITLFLSGATIALFISHVKLMMESTTLRTPRRLTRIALAHLLALTIAVVASAIYWHFFSVDGRTFSHAAAEFKRIAADKEAEGAFPWILSQTIEPAFSLLMHDPYLFALAALASFLAGVCFVLFSLTWSVVYSWQAYIGFTSSPSTKLSLARRASNFAELTWKSPITLYVIMLLGVGVSYGLPLLVSWNEYGAMSRIIFGE